MGELHIGDLLALDRDVADGASRLARWRADLARDPEAHDGEDPLERVRHVAGRSTWVALGELSPSEVDRPLRDALREWVLALTFSRVEAAEAFARAKAEHAPGGMFLGEDPRRVSWREAFRGVPSAKSAPEVGLWLAAAAEGAPDVAAAARELSAKRTELARRFGLEHPWGARFPVPAATVRDAASRLLDTTEDLARAVWRGTPRGPEAPAATLHEGVGREVGEGWPAHLTRRWLEETLGLAATGLTVRLPPLPASLGATSFMRAMAVFGGALQRAAAPRAMPFALAREPGGRASHRLAFVLASLPAQAEWQTRVLGVAKRAAAAQARAMARSILLDSRLGAARVLLGDDAAPAPIDLFHELGERVLGGRLDRRLHGAWPAAHDDEPARFVARIEAKAAADELTSRFDSDWFRNPSAWAHVRTTAGAAVREPVEGEALQRAVEALTRAFEGALG